MIGSPPGRGVADAGSRERARQAEREAVTANIDRMIQQFDWRRQRERARVQRGAGGAVTGPAVAECVVVDLMEYRARRDASAAAGGA